MAFAIVGNHTRAQELAERALSGFALKHSHLTYSDHPWTQHIDDLTQWTMQNRLQMMEQLWDILQREEKLTDAQGFFALGKSERMVLHLRARTALELEQIASLMQLSSSETVALLERARHELLSRAAPGLLEEPSARQCRHTLRIEALAALDVERFADDFLVRHMQECEICHQHFTQARTRRDGWLAFIPEGEIPRSLQRDFEQRLPEFLKEVMPKNHASLQGRASRMGKGVSIGLVDLARAALRPSFLVTVGAIIVTTWLVWKMLISTSA